MMIDLHYHVDSQALHDHSALQLPAGCIVSRRPQDNAVGESLARRGGVACALFADPRALDWRQTIELVSQGRALAYNHFEMLDTADFALIAPVLAASECRGVPVVLHLSRHDRDLFDEYSAARCLDDALDRFPNLRVIVSHCGGENSGVVVRAARDCPRVLLDTSRLEETSRRSGHVSSDALLQTIADSLPADRLLYGSDQSWPNYSEDSKELSALAKVFGEAALDDICVAGATAILAALESTTASAGARN